ncbi:hypothetical protein R4K52_10330 [Brachyspira pilosicoli]|uniref:hypothetical protein n=1 Tax=Brachyspira pilosicoli TaxID=52584 RepID=UPI00300791A5
MRYFIVLYNTFLWSMIISFIMFKNVWLEMRMNIGLCFFIIWALLFIIFIFINNKKHIFEKHSIFSLINLIICFIIALIILSPSAILYTPSSIIRDGLYAKRLLKLNTINIVLFIFMFSGILTILISSLTKKLIKNKISESK